MSTVTRVASILLVASLALSWGCASGSSSSESGGSVAPAASASPPPPGSALAKVQAGMSDEQVRAALGSPTSTNSYMTGKGWIPFYYGPDTHRTDWVYAEHSGRVVFSRNRWSGGLKVIRVDHTP